MRAGLEDDASDQVGVDGARRVDGPARRLLDLADDLAAPRRRTSSYAVVSSTVSRRSSPRHQPLELALDLAELPAAVLLDDEQEEVADELVGAAEDVLERLRLRARIDLRVAQQRVELGHVVDRGREVAELLADGREPPRLLRGFEERARVRAVGDAQRASRSRCRLLAREKQAMQGRREPR